MYWSNLKSIAFPVPEIIARGYPKNWGSPWIRPRFLCRKFFHGLLFGWTLLLFWPNLKFVALPVHEIISWPTTHNPEVSASESGLSVQNYGAI